MRTKEEIEKEIKTLESKVLELKKELHEKSNYTLMYLNKSGKHTFVLQPNNQRQNLSENGWKVFNKNQLKMFLDNYDI